MIPTCRLRFVERDVLAPEYGEGVAKTVRVLQQWWEDEEIQRGEWRDVELEKEQ